MENIIQIEKYLEGALTGDDRKGFEKRLETDPTFQKEFKTYKDVIKGIGYQGQEDFKNTVARWEAQIRQKESGSHKSGAPVRNIRSLRNRYLAIAATVTALLAFAWLLWPNGGSDAELIAQLTPSEVYEQYYTPFPDKISVRGGGERLMKTAISLYNEKAYAAALVKFDSLLVDSPSDDRLALYKGICLMETGNPEDASVLFEQVAKGESEFVEEGEWYLALAEIQMKDPEAAKNRFRNMANKENHDHKKEAAKILSQWK